MPSPSTTAERYLSGLVQQAHTPAVQYAFFDTQKVWYQYQTGYADLAANTVLNSHHTFHAYSATKTITALAILQLVQQHHLDIHEPVKKHLPDFPYGERVTIQHLLTHTSGIPNPVPLSWIHLADEHEGFNSRGFFNGIMAKNPTLAFAPGSRFAYSNLGYVFLGRLIEHLSGQPYEEYVTQHILQRTGANPADISFSINPALQAKGYIRRYSFLNFVLDWFINKQKYMDEPEGAWRPFKNIYMNGAPYGGLVGNAKGFISYLQALLQPGSTLLSDNLKQLMFTENTTDNGRRTGMCMGWYTGILNGQRYCCHAGGGGGYYCEIRVYPQLGLGSVIFCNRTGVSDERLLNNTDAMFIKQK